MARKKLLTVLPELDEARLGPPTEEQRFRQPWLWFLLGVLGPATIGAQLYGYYQQRFLGLPWGNQPVSDGELLTSALVSAAVIGGVSWLAWISRLRVWASPQGLRLRFYPFHLKVRGLEPEQIRGATAVCYRPLWDYGGWGIRWGKGGRVFSVSGVEGLRLELGDGRHLMIGSQDPVALLEALGPAGRQL